MSRTLTARLRMRCTRCGYTLRGVIDPRQELCGVCIDLPPDHRTCRAVPEGDWHGYGHGRERNRHGARDET